MEFKIGWCQTQPSCCQGKGQGRKRDNGFQEPLSDNDKYFLMGHDREEADILSIIYDAPAVILRTTLLQCYTAIRDIQARYQLTLSVMQVAQYFANFFVSESRKNAHKFSSEEEEEENLIYNYSPVYTGRLDDSSFEQAYFFDV